MMRLLVGLSFLASFVLVRPDVLGAREGISKQPRPSIEADAATWCALHQSKREYQRAISACTEALRDHAGDAELHSNRGAAYLMLDELDQAIIDFNAALRIEPSNPIHYFNRGTAYTKKKDNSNAIADYSEAIRLAPRLAPAYNNRGHEFEIAGERDKAIADYRTALRLAPALKDIVERNLRRLGAE